MIVSSAYRWNYYNYGQVSICEIDSLKKTEEQYNFNPKLEALKEISENDIKKAFAEIIFEENVPKDWGGEKSDLFSTNVIFRGKPTPTAFCFKGPAKFSPMTLNHLGKNGDQIDRLFSEPADLLILQHCHKVLTPVRSMIRAYASRIYDLRHFCIIDGYDTIRLLRAYKKCGF